MCFAQVDDECTKQQFRHWEKLPPPPSGKNATRRRVSRSDKNLKNVKKRKNV